MKTNVINLSVRSNNVKLPALYESINEPLVILLVIGKEDVFLEGIVLISKDANSEIGEFSSTWDMNEFQPMQTGSKVELIQE